MRVTFIWPHKHDALFFGLLLAQAFFRSPGTLSYAFVFLISSIVTLYGTEDRRLVATQFWRIFSIIDVTYVFTGHTKKQVWATLFCIKLLSLHQYLTRTRDRDPLGKGGKFSIVARVVIIGFLTLTKCLAP